MESGIRTLHWAKLGARPAGAGGQLFALWPAPVQADECFKAAGFTDFGDGGAAWDADDARLVGAVLAVLGEHGEARVRGDALVKRPSLWERLRGRKTETATPLQQLANASTFDSEPSVVEFGDPARARVLRADGHEILWIWLDDAIAAIWPALLARAAGDLPLVETALAWDRLLPEELS